MSAALRTVSRTIVTPVTIVLFVVSTVTGIMLLLHWQAGLVRFSHEWLSIAFSAIAVWHLVRNWTAFIQYFRRNLALGAFAVSLIASVVITGMTGAPSSNANPGAIFRALSASTLETAAPALGLTPAAAIQTLKTANIDAAASETLTQIGAKAGMNGAGVASLLVTRQRRS
ncbi:DUF4405 domain-containing protein [Azospirillum sp. TSO22-1]|uniref:DUF4405 domain-containing protein n=1 Tax=Azospirillum sp. TSO22-1 TaxID=716789 RepID=UPI000D619E08|nr:DUF4405 domain-containing protein [Azospirillum sp. TSO22-1]PWC45698.1 hypothetical protein TSO221_16130 [Azospirillum sp. TSO22-1]